MRTTLNTLAFVAALVATCAAIHRALPARGDVPVLSAKLAWLAAQPDRYDTIILGSSRVFDAAWPRVFDEKMAALGHPTRSFNLAAAGMNFPETLYVLDRALEHLVKPPRFVILEAGNLYHGPPRTQPDESLRALHWHDWHHTRLACESILRSADRRSDGARETLRLLAWNASLFARNCSNVGRCADLFRREKRKPAKVNDDGFNRVNLTMPATDAAAFTPKVANKPQNAALPVKRDPVLAEEMRRVTQRLAARGTRVFFVLLPEFRSSLPEPPPTPLIDLDDAVRFPALWRPEHRFDAHHLNADGAAIFSALLASQVAAQLR